MYIIEYGSTLYVGMAQGENGCPINRVQIWYPSETITGVPKRQFAKRLNRQSSSLSSARLAQ